MNDEKYISKKQLIQECGLSRSTFYRYAKEIGCTLKRHFLSPAEARELRSAILNKGGTKPFVKNDDPI